MSELEQRLQAFYQAHCDKVHLTYQEEADRCKSFMQQQVSRRATVATARGNSAPSKIKKKKRVKFLQFYFLLYSFFCGQFFPCLLLQSIDFSVKHKCIFLLFFLKVGELKSSHEAAKLELQSKHVEELQSVKQQYETSLEGEEIIL